MIHELNDLTSYFFNQGSEIPHEVQTCMNKSIKQCASKNDY